MNFCSQCGAPVARAIPPGDDRVRYVCTRCGTVHYQNPKMVVGCIPEWHGQVLLCRRAIEPRLGFWTLPAGFLENGETLAQAAAREALEEANARVDVDALYTVLDLPHIDQVYLFFLARLRDAACHPGRESLEVGLFHEQEIPWENLAFATVHLTLRHFYADRRDGHFPVHTKTVSALPGGRFQPDE
jgi:ADP-ribose pyrophosphatase YjhB (NUDIX family)